MPAWTVSHGLKSDTPVHRLSHGRCIEHDMMAPHLPCKVARLPRQRGPDPLVASRKPHTHRKQPPYPPFAGRDIEHTSPHYLILLESDQAAHMARKHLM